MKYVALRLREGTRNTFTPVIEIQGQRDFDLNWENATPYAFESKAEARDYAIGMAMRERIESVYDLNGYGLKHLDESWDEYLTRLQEEADAKNK